MPDSTFASIGLSADIVRALVAQGIESPFQIQTRVIPAALAGQDVLAKAPTGSGGRPRAHPRPPAPGSRTGVTRMAACW